MTLSCIPGVSLQGLDSVHAFKNCHLVQLISGNFSKSLTSAWQLETTPLLYQYLQRPLLTRIDPNDLSRSVL